jgi:hypothetical protein
MLVCDHSPSLVVTCAWNRFFSRHSPQARVCSATLTGFCVAVFATLMPLARQASKSMGPGCWMSFRARAESIISEVTRFSNV